MNGVTYTESNNIATHVLTNSEAATPLSHWI